MIKILKLLSSFKLAIFLLLSIMILVIIGTIFQSQSVSIDVQERFFRSFFVIQDFGSFKIPIFPGGYLLGSLLIFNLLSSLVMNVRLLWSKLGIYLIHLGVALLVIGETLGGIYSMETFLPLSIGEKKNYSIKEDETSSRYFPFWMELIEFKHEKYPGTNIPKSFSSLVQIYSSEGKVIRTASISMNHPLKYQGYTFYQAGFGKDDQESILKVVKNPVSLSPYLFSFIVVLGFIYQLAFPFFANSLIKSEFRERFKPLTS